MENSLKAQRAIKYTWSIQERHLRRRGKQYMKKEKEKKAQGLLPFYLFFSFFFIFLGSGGQAA
jgi:hypothetical protein